MSSQKQSLLKNAIKILCIDKTSRTVLFKDALNSAYEVCIWVRETLESLENKGLFVLKSKAN